MGTTKDIIAKAMKDQAFRESLKKDARATLKKEMGIDFPDDVSIRVHENSPSVINLVLPGAVDLSSQRTLSEAELSQVAGGLMRRSTMSGDTFGSYTGCCSVKS